MKGSHPTERFYLADRVREEEKYFGISLSEIERQLTRAGVFEGVCEHDIEDDGEAISLELRFNLCARSKITNSWTASLKLHGIRIDGVDYESRFTTEDGSLASGWHRHQWDSVAKDAEKKKVLLSGFGKGLTGVSAFVIRVTKELRIRLDRHDHGRSDLPFD